MSTTPPASSVINASGVSEPSFSHLQQKIRKLRQLRDQYMNDVICFFQN
jgi:hypothetical protein